MDVGGEDGTISSNKLCPKDVFPPPPSSFLFYEKVGEERQRITAGGAFLMKQMMGLLLHTSYKDIKNN